jgi:transcriptional regulator with XRE-family HTH domain
MSVGKRIKERREQLGMSQVKLSQLASISKTYLWELEAGKADTGIGATVLYALAQELGQSMEWLLTGKPDCEKTQLKAWVEYAKCSRKLSLLRYSVFGDAERRSLSKPILERIEELEQMLGIFPC